MSPRQTVFEEAMLGHVRLSGETALREVRLDLRAIAGGILLPHRTTEAKVTGSVRIVGFPQPAPVTGSLEISPLARRRIRYQLVFPSPSGHRYTIDGWKSVSLGRPVRSMTTLPFSLFDHEGTRAGQGTLRFPVASGLLPFLTSFRFPSREAVAAPSGPERFFAPRWKGEQGRMEVWYTTVTDPTTGTGLWLHHELTAPTDGAPARAHGWVALFPKGGPVEHARFGPEPYEPPTRASEGKATEGAPHNSGGRNGTSGIHGGKEEGFHAAGVEAGASVLRGNAGGIRWDLTAQADDSAPLYTFPRWSWRRPLLPAAQMVPAPRVSFSGTVWHAGGELRLEAAPGATARIYGHGNARRWAWLHADLGDGDVLEIVAATSTRPVLRRLPPLVFLRLRKDGRTWPRRPERTAVGWAGFGRFRADIGLPTWTVTGRAGLRRIRVRVTQPLERTLSLDYVDPDGATAVCRNSETADARVLLERWWGRWRTEARWALDRTAHAEVGDR